MYGVNLLSEGAKFGWVKEWKGQETVKLLGWVVVWIVSLLGEEAKFWWVMEWK